VTPNDTQIDALMRRYARRAKNTVATEHLDADELNAFAEGRLPPAARFRYVSHLSDCDDCRRIATGLIRASGATAAIAVADPQDTGTSSWRQKLSGFFAPRKLRYAAFALVLFAAAGVTFLALRHQREATMVAGNEAPRQMEVVKQSQEERSEADKIAPAIAKGSPSASQPAQTSNFELKRDESKVAENAPPPPKAQKEPPPSKPAVAANRTAETSNTQTLPSFAPPPPAEAERAQMKTREQQNVGGIAALGGRKDESSSDKSKALDQTRAAETSKDRRADDNRAVDSQSSVRFGKPADQKASGPQRQRDNTLSATSRGANEVRVETARKQPAPATGRAGSEEVSETRAAGGRKFRRQGNAWVDTKFKSSMSIRNVSRGTDEYAALDGGIRSIAERLSGEIIVVWKGKAYRIH